MKPDTTDLVARLEGLLEKATPGTWAVAEDRADRPHQRFIGSNGGNNGIWIAEAKGGDCAANAALIAEAITALPALLAAVREGEAEVEKLRAATEPFSEAWANAADKYPGTGDVWLVEEARSYLCADDFRALSPTPHTRPDDQSGEEG